ncbi:sensor histidine kinase [Planosporangium thailandense]|uniref:histidine kinase n=1 Tax=Planosporangium thailandense TaxID=765197 RepID=A0ABX0XZY1_9ACTN|nr:nitrate- and nitrite sensing domain-containing protein [Planosporangium thailandense]NJC70760.1 sensor histidine kinase [Planosporangium thailandense]
MLARLSVQQKLSVLLTLPLAALVLTGVPFAVARLDSTIAAAVAVDAAHDARDVAELVEGLQSERLLALASLASPEVDRSGYAALGATSADRAEEAAEHGTPAVRRAVGQLGSLDAVRRQVLDGTAAPAEVQGAYHARIIALIDALELTRQPRVDITGLRQLSALDALLRANEEAYRIGGALLIAATDKRAGADLAIEARSLHRIDIDRFRQQAEGPAVSMLDAVERGDNARRLDELSSQVSAGNGLPAPLPEIVANVRSAATQGGALQERVVHATVVRAQDRAAAAGTAAVTLIGLAVALLVFVIWMSFRVSRSVAVPLRQLTSAARRVADLASDELVRVADTDAYHRRPPNLATVEVGGSDEIGELAAAFNRVQTTAALLMERQVASRRNVAVMFATVGRRTRSLVARQLAFIDEFERNEQDERMLVKLYRLDHLTTRLRRSADSLLVVSGIREDEPISAAASLHEVVRSAIAEIEGYQAVRIAALCEVTIMPQLVPDLRLLLAELLENATAFSPPGSPVEVYARLGSCCEIVVVDHGIGMSDERLAEENRRLVERERLDIAPTSVLGLFVVGRIARRHGLRVRLRHSPGNGVSAEVQVPTTLFTTDRVLPINAAPAPRIIARRAVPPASRAYAPGRDRTRELAQLTDWASGQYDVSFAWFQPQEISGTVVDATVVDTTATGASVTDATTVGPDVVDVSVIDEDAPAGPTALPATPAGPHPEPAPARHTPEPASSTTPASTRSGLTRRQPGGHLPAFGMDLSGTEQPRADAAAASERAPAARGSLTRRVPGTHLDRSLRGDGTSDRSAPGAQPRDPDAERAELDSFVAGVARAAGASRGVGANQ